MWHDTCCIEVSKEGEEVMAGIQSGGIGSGLDINGLVSQLVAAEGQPKLLRVDRKEVIAQSELSALSSFKGALSDFQGKIASLTDHSTYDNRTVNSSDNSIVSISATNDALVGNYEVEVTQLAQAHKIASSGFASSTTVVGEGVLSFSFGTYDSDGNTFTINPNSTVKTVSIDSSNNTLEGIRDAVNEADIGVTASIINDGSGERLVFGSQASGAENSLRVTVDDDDGTDTDTAGLSQLAYDPTAAVGSGQNLSETIAALDATLVIDGIAVTSPSNSVTSAIQGVTLNIKQAEVGTKVNLSVDIDTGGIKAKVNTFVKEFNTMMKAINDLSKYDPETEKAAILNGDVMLRSAESQIRRTLTETISGLTGAVQSLADIGVSTQSDGTLSVDSSQLDEALDEDYEAFAVLFAAIGRPTDSQIGFVSSTDDTTIGDYTVNITQVATQGQIVGSAAANLTITDGVNDTLSFSVNGQNATIDLTAGTYTADELAIEVQTKLNGISALSDNGITVSVSQSGGVMTLISDEYGSSSSVDITGGNGKDDFIGLAPVKTDGVDVEGTINGSSASGAGQFLTGTGSAEGLKLEITGGSTGSRGRVNFTRGIADQINTLLDSYLDGDSIIDQRTEIINSRIDDLASQREAISLRLEAYEKRLLQQFTSLDILVASLKSTSDFLAGQLENLPGATPIRKS